MSETKSSIDFNPGGMDGPPVGAPAPDVFVEGAAQNLYNRPPNAAESELLAKGYSLGKGSKRGAPGEQPSQLHEAGMAFGQVAATFIGASVLVNGLYDVVNAARDKLPDGGKRWTTAALGAGKAAAGAATVYFALAKGHGLGRE